MMFFSAIVLTVVRFSTLVFAHDPTRLVYQGHVGSWFENLAVRHNGSILLTSLNVPGQLHSLNPFDGSDPVLVAEFPSVNSTLGIVETEKDRFYVLGNNFSLAATTLGPKAHTNRVFHVDFRNCGPEGRPTVTELVHLRRAHFLNGLTKFNNTLLLAADSGLGAVWAIDTRSGAAWIVAEDPLMAPIPLPNGYSEGINGIHFRDGAVYFTNTQKRLFAELDLDKNAVAAGPAIHVATSKTEMGEKVLWDDFAFDNAGNAYVGTENGNSVQKVTARGEVVVVAGNLNSTVLAEPTSASFGRTWRDRDILYVATSGGLGYPVYDKNGPIVIGAQVVAVDIRLYP